MNSCARTLFEWHVEGRGYLPQEWRGWRIVGNALISPGKERITPERLAVLLMLEKRFAGGGVAAKSGEA